MLKSLMSKWRQKRGFTMTEVMVVVAIIAVVAAIAIPSAIAIRNSLQFQERNNYARSIFLAAQTELMEMRSSGELEKLPEVNNEAGSSNIAISQKDGAATPSGYIYTTSADTTYFEMLLPAGSMDETVRDGQIIIEYSPRTGNIYAVFYYEGNDDVLAKYSAGQLTRKEDERKKMKLGYYDGSDLADPDLGVYYVEADVLFENGHEGMVTVVVPAQASVPGGNINFMGDNYNAYANGLEVTLTVTGEQGGTFTKTIKTYGNADNCTVSSGEGGVNAIYVSFPLDSLKDQMSFASLAENDLTPEGTPVARTLTSIAEGDYVIIPGDNVSITAEVSFRPGMDDPMVIIESAAIAGVNPMFDSLTPGTNGYILAVSNGRNLQNLNAIAPEIAEKVEAVVFNPSALGKPAGTDPVNIIDWNDTVAYYNNKYGTGSTVYENAANEAPARALPYFVPIHNEYLFGTVTFQKDDGGNVPMWAEVHNRANNAANADIVGNNVRIYNLNVDTARNVTNKAFYAGSDGAANNRLAGLFGYINTNIDSVFVVNPVIRGAQLATDGQAYPSAAGALVGVAGKDTYISNCGAYIDTTAADFVRTNLNMGSFTGKTEEANNREYGVSGYGAVGGLVGYIKSDQIDIKTVTGSYGAVPVFANMHMGTNCGYYNGVGGFVGNAQMVSFSDCYASGYVGTTNCVALPITISKNTLGIEHSGSDSTGAGGFAGTSHASQYYNCFATGNVRGNSDSTGAFVGVLCYDSALGGRTAYLLDCYAVGDTFNTANFESFSGVHAVIKSNSVNAFEVQNSESTADHNITPNTQFSVNCYYLSQYDDNVSEKSNDATKYCAKPQTYNDLKAIRWNSAQASAETTHSYDLQAQNAVYPFAIQNATTHYYGSWPAQKADVGIAYYEFYSSEENAVPGYYFDRQSTATLKNQTVINDGYLVLSASTITKLTVNGESITIPTSKQVTLGNDAYNAYVLPLDKISKEGYYTTVVAETSIKNQDNSTTPVTATMYFNPNVALSQVNGATTAPKDAPSTIYVRSARQLAALGSESIQNLTDKSFIQQLDIDFSIAKDVTLSGNSVVSTFGKNTYNGDRHTITGVGKTIFGTNNGRILNCTVIGSADKKLATTGNGFVATNYGTIQNCSITGPGSISGAGFVGSNSGTIENCYVTPVARGGSYVGKKNENLKISNSGFATTNSGTIKNCYVLGTVNGSAGFVETNEGTIENCKANVNMSGDGKYAFVKTNAGEVKTSYGWVTGGADLATPGAKGCYFALMNGEKDAILYDKDGNNTNYSLDALGDAAAFVKLGEGWSPAKSQKAYPYSSGLTDYPFPMIGSHYGNWTIGKGSMSYGVLYYEQYEKDWYVDKVNLSGSDDMPFDGTAATMIEAASTDIVQQAGYVLYCRAGQKPFDTATNELIGQSVSVAGLHSAADLSELYSFYSLNPQSLTVTVTGASKDNAAAKSVKLIPYFADTITREGVPAMPYKIRTQEQLENISRASVEAFVIDRSVKIDASYTAIPEFTGKLTSNGGQIHASNVKTGIIGTMLGESSLIDGVDVYIDNTESALFSGTKGVLVNVLKNGTIQNCTNVTANVMVNATGSDNVGILVGEMQGGKIDNCIINGSLGFKVSGSAKVGGVVGRVLGGTISNVTSNTTVAVGGTTDDVGMFVGAADGGTFTNCETTAANTNLHFAGAFDKATETVEGASHYSIKEKLADGIYESTSRFTEGNSCTKPVNAKFTQCAFKLNNADDLVLVTQDYHFYKIEKVGGYDAKQQEKSAAFSNLTANPAYSSFSETVTTDWVATRYFANIDGEYYRLSVMVTVKTEDEQETPVTQAEGDADTDENTGNEGNQPDNGGNTGDSDNESGTGETEQKPVTYVYQFRYNVGDTAVVSDAVEVTDLGATSVITFGEKTPKICIVSALPSTGTFMLVNDKNEILTFNKNGNIEWIAYTEGNPVTTDGMIWSAGEVWNNQLKNVIKESRTTVTEDNVTTVTSTKSEFNLTAQVTRDENCPQKNGYLSVKVNYTITEKITTTVTVGDGAPDVTEDSKRISEEIYLYLYILTENTDSLVTHVDTREGLTLTGLENAQNTESVQAAAETAAPVKETETSTAPDGAAEVPVDGNDETEH